MPELQGRFPIRVEMHDLTRDDFARILREPRASLLRQYQALLCHRGPRRSSSPSAADRAMADLAFQVNQSTQNIGARRLHTILERVLEDISFDAPGPRRTRRSWSTRRSSASDWRSSPRMRI